MTEHQVTEAVLGRAATGTRLVVAHWAATAARADTVAWLDGGGSGRWARMHSCGRRLPGYRAVFWGRRGGGRSVTHRDGLHRLHGHLGHRALRALRFLFVGRRAMVRLAGWSVLETGQTFLLGYALARALDDGFLAGRAAVGLGWLAAAGLGVLVRAYGTGRVYGAVAALVEPLRDRLVTGVVRRGVREGDRGALSGLTQQVEIARDTFAGLVMVSRSFVFTSVGALAGLCSLAPLLLLPVVPPLVAGVALFAATPASRWRDGRRRTSPPTRPWRRTWAPSARGCGTSRRPARRTGSPRTPARSPTPSSGRPAPWPAGAWPASSVSQSAATCLWSCSWPAPPGSSTTESPPAPCSARSPTSASRSSPPSPASSTAWAPAARA
ncbi:hypothetical protein O1M63_47275 [Streptomyces mirabilis]|nr:hypothetical protein [Streptomyces mirabilis]